MQRKNNKKTTTAKSREQIHQELDEILAKARRQETLTTMVGVVLSALRLLGLQLVRMVLEQRDDGIQDKRKGPVRCPKCGSKMWKPNRKETSRMTLLGKVRYRRRCYLCRRCRTTHSPLDSTLGLKSLHRGHSAGFVRELGLMCVLHAFGRGCDLFSRSYGFEVSTHLAYPLVMGVGQKLYDDEMKKADRMWKLRHEEPLHFEPMPTGMEAKKRPGRVYVMMDNCKARIQEGKRGRGAKKRKKRKGVEERFNIDIVGPNRPPKAEKRAKKEKKKKKKKKKNNKGNDSYQEGDWRDVRAVLIYREDDLAECNKGRRSLLRRRIGAHVGTKEEFRKLLNLWFYEEGVYLAEEVVVVADGGAGIWELVEELLPKTSQRRVTQILDWCHAVTHLWKVAKKLWTGDTKKAIKRRKRWVDGLVKYLAVGKVSNVLQRLKGKQKRTTGEPYEELRRCIDYLETHRNRMRYGYYRKRKMTIGSGAIESVHKWVIQARCKQAGMAWSQRGLNAMLRLRCAWASDRWDDVFAAEQREETENVNDSVAAA